MSSIRQQAEAPLEKAAPCDARSAQELLSEFASTGRQRPFEQIVRRYAGMVFHVCLQVTRNTHDAEDATQAVFLTLAVQAKTGQTIRRLGPWLQRVAHRLALDLRKAKQRRERRELRHGALLNWDGGNGQQHKSLQIQELRKILYEEMQGLPSKYRLPLILHYFGGLDRQTLAQELNCRPGTLGARLHRGRQMLGWRLARRGIALADGTLALALIYSVQSTVSDAMVASTSLAAAQLTHGAGLSAGLVSAHIVRMAQHAVHTALCAKLKAVAIALVIAGTALGAGAEVISRAAPLKLLWTVPLDLGKLLWPLFGSVPAPVTNGQGLPTPSIGLGPILPSESGTHQPGTRLQPGALASTALEPYASLLTEPPVVDPQSVTWLPVSCLPTRSRCSPVTLQSAAPAGSDGHEWVFRHFLPKGKYEPGNSFGSPLPKIPASAMEQSVPGGRVTQTRPKGLPCVAQVSQTGPAQLAAYGQLVPLADSGHGGIIRPLALPPSQTSPGPAGDGPPTVQPVHGHDPIVPSEPDRSALVEHKPAPSPATAAQAAPAPPPVACDSEPLRVPAYVLPDRATYLAALSSAGTGLGNLVLSEEPQNTDAAGYLAAVHAAISESVYSEVAGSLLSDGVESSAQPAVQPRILLKGVRIGSSAESLQGWGDLLNRGTLNQSGRVVADGLGQMRTLDLSRVAAIQNSFDNPLTGENGWYAQNGGKLVLPPLDIATGTNTYTWGEQDDDPVLDLINSVRVKLVDVTRAAPVEIALLAVDRPDLPALPAGHTPIGLWSFSATGLEAAAVELSVRYDDVLARRLQLSESTLKLWGYDQEGWHLLTDAFFCDVNNKLISARAESLSYFAVTSPEPSGMLLAVGLAAALASRRQRRR